MIMRMATLLCLILVGACEDLSQSTNREQSSDIEQGEIRFASSSPYDFIDAIHGDAAAVEILAYLQVPPAEDKIPAVVILHDSGGYSTRYQDRYGSMLNDLGIASLVLDSFGPRSVGNTLQDQIAVTEQMMMADAFSALRLLADDPRIDPERIAVMGFSKGAVVALYTAFAPIPQWYGFGQDLKFAAHAAFYPYCGIAIDGGRLTGAPVQLLLGELDDYTPAKPCLDLALEADPGTHHFDIKLYANSHHLFDSRGSAGRNEHALNPGNCSFRVGRDGKTYHNASGQPASTMQQRSAALRQCGSMGVTVGGNPTARDQSLIDLRVFFTQTLLEK